MGELTFFLIITGLIVIVSIALFSYYIHHKKIRDEVQGFGQHANQIDDVLLQQHAHEEINTSINDDELPESFSTRIDDPMDFDLATKATAQAELKPTQERKKALVIDDAMTDDLYAEPASAEILTEAGDISEAMGQKTPETSHVIPGQVINMAKEPLPEGIKDLIIAMAIKRADSPLTGKEILTACQACNIQYGEMNIFHYPADNNPTTYALFSIANMLEPGTFELDQMDDFSTTGLSLFMQLPLPMNCLDAYDIFIEKARLLAKFLNADLYDETFNLVTSQAISHNKEKINILHHEISKARKLQTS